MKRSKKALKKLRKQEQISYVLKVEIIEGKYFMVYFLAVTF